MTHSRNTPVKAIIFDHDGTLVDSEPMHLSFWQQALAPFAQTLTGQQYAENLAGIPSIESAKWLIQTFDLDTSAEDLLAQKTAYLKHYLHHSAYPLLPGVSTLLELLHRHQWPMAVASGAGVFEVTRSVHFHNLESYFQSIATKDHVENNKPAPDVYLLAAASLGVDPEFCLAIEDTDTGQSAALAAGMTCLRLNTLTRLPHSSRCHKITSMTDVGTWLKLSPTI